MPPYPTPPPPNPAGAQLRYANQPGWPPMADPWGNIAAAPAKALVMAVDGHVHSSPYRPARRRGAVGGVSSSSRDSASMVAATTRTFAHNPWPSGKQRRPSA